MGNWTWWYQNGQLKYEGKYIADEKDGSWIEYQNDGTVIVDGVL